MSEQIDDRVLRVRVVKLPSTGQLLDDYYRERGYKPGGGVWGSEAFLLPVKHKGRKGCS